MSNHHECLNCNEKLVGNFCYNCGQKADTHRITTKHFLFHDILHGVWHIDKGILFTLKEAIVRPGQAALDYIKGKRIKYYNVFYLCLFLIGIRILAVHYYEASHHYNESNLEKFTTSYTKPLIFLLVPLLASISFLFFKKMKLNFAEHCILGGVILVRIMLISILSDFLYFFFHNLTLAIFSSLLIGLCIMSAFYDFAMDYYPKENLIVRSFAMTFLFFVAIVAFFVIGEFVIFGKQ